MTSLALRHLETTGTMRVVSSTCKKKLKYTLALLENRINCYTCDRERIISWQKQPFSQFFLLFFVRILPNTQTRLRDYI